MRGLVICLLALVAAPATVLACEGDCIVGITNAFLGNYTYPVHKVLLTIVSSLSTVLYV